MNTIVRVRQEGASVLLIIDERATEMPWDAAIELGRALIAKGHLAEEIAKHEQVIEDQAILTRAGIPIGLAVDERVVQEAAKEAAWSTKLRRWIPGGVKSRQMVWGPTVRRQRK